MSMSELKFFIDTHFGNPVDLINHSSDNRLIFDVVTILQQGNWYIMADISKKEWIIQWFQILL